MKKVFTVVSIAIVFCMFQVIFFLLMNGTTTEAAPESDFQEQIDALSTEIERMKIQFQDLYFMTEPLRIRVADKDGGSFYYARNHNEARGPKMWGMLPSELALANLYYEIRLGAYSKEKTKELTDKMMAMPRNTYLNLYKPRYNFYESSLVRDADTGIYVLPVPFFE